MSIDAISDPLSVLGPLEPAGASAARAAQHAAEAPGEKAAKDFESVLLHKLLQEMARTVDDSPLLEDSASKQVKDMFWYYLAQDLADKGGLGLWKQIAGQSGYAEARQGEVNP